MVARTNVGHLETGEAVGAQRGLPADEQQGVVAGVRKLLVGAQGAQLLEERGATGGGAVSGRDGATPGWRRIPAIVRRTGSVGVGLSCPAL